MSDNDGCTTLTRGVQGLLNNLFVRHKTYYQLHPPMNQMPFATGTENDVSDDNTRGTELPLATKPATKGTNNFSPFFFLLSRWLDKNEIRQISTDFQVELKTFLTFPDLEIMFFSAAFSTTVATLREIRRIWKFMRI